MLVSLSVAMDVDRVIGRDNRLPWHLPSELKLFRALTMGKPILMGRRTWESIGKPLPGRHSIVLSRAPLTLAGAETARSLDEALALAAAHGEEAVVIGGAALFAEAIDRVDRVYLTIVEAAVGGDARFVLPREDRWQLVERRRVERDAANAYSFDQFVLKRSPAGDTAIASLLDAARSRLTRA